MSYSPQSPFKDTANSTTTPLSGAATYTGTGVLSTRPAIMVQTKSDVSGTLYFDFSVDGTNWDSTYPTAGYACAAGVPEVHTANGATTLRIKAGGNTNDAAAGSGARGITLEGLDENFAFASETIATNGASASSATTTTFTRLFRAYVSASGTYATSSAGSAAAEIEIENGSGGTTWGFIPYPTSAFPESQSSIGAYSIPAGKSAYVFLDDITVDSGKTADVIFFSREGADETSAPYSPMRAKSVLTGLTGGATDLSGRNVPLGKFTGPCDIGFLGRVSATTGQIAVEFEVYEVSE